jgi:hypothetical protein
MNRRTAMLSSSFAFLVSSGTAHARTTFDAAGVAHLPSDGKTVRTYDFEKPESLIGSLLFNGVTGKSTEIRGAADVASYLTSGELDAVEGSHAIRVGGASYQVLDIYDPKLFADVKEGRFEISLWARADGAFPAITVRYDRDIAVDASPTGRRTTDGWNEYVAGPLDANVAGQSPLDIIIDAESSESGSRGTVVIDALEIRAVDGQTIAPKACTQANVDDVCGAEGSCLYGHCLSSTATWGVLPPIELRKTLVERWIHFATRALGDRRASDSGESTFAPRARELLETATSSRQFFGGLARLVHLLRNSHTTFGAPRGAAGLGEQVTSADSSLLGACFGLVEKDLLGGGLGYAVFGALDAPPVGTKLKVGDVLTAIDGRDPKAWVDDYWPSFTYIIPNDPSADWGASAMALAALVSKRASTLTFTRCASKSSCTGNSRQEITIDIGDRAYDLVKGGKVEFDELGKVKGAFDCSARFTNSVLPLASAPSGQDAVSVMVGSGGETRIQFDGFAGGPEWEAKFDQAFSSKPANVIVDARVGTGGQLSEARYLLNLFRSSSDPLMALVLGRGEYDDADPPWLFDVAGACVDGTEDTGTCSILRERNFSPVTVDPPGASARVAWLDTADVSANDLIARALKGRANFRIFAPHPTNGAFGAILSLPALSPNWGGGSIQIQDARFGTTLQALRTARWESGYGVAPDDVVVEKLSDALGGIDTILETALAWVTGK